MGRNIELNQQGQKFKIYALKLHQDYQQMCSEFNQGTSKQTANIVGPSVLVDHGIDAVFNWLVTNNLGVNIKIMYEGDALKALDANQADIAIVTSHALSTLQNDEYTALVLGKTAFTLAVGNSHQLNIQTSTEQNEQTLAQILQYPFVCPASSPFCGIVRGIGSDGWPDLRYRRKIAFRCDDFSSLLALVRQGQALAYVPELVVKANDLLPLSPTDCNVDYQEEYALVFKPAVAHSWLHRLHSSLS